jgi:aspartate aminotransferase
VIVPIKQEDNPTMALSRLATSIPESPTLKLNDAARQLKEKGEPVINFTVGEPKNKTPQTAIAAVEEALHHSEIKYTPASGLPLLKKAIIDYTEANYGRRVTPKNVIVSAGAKNSLYTLFCTLLDPGDEVIFTAPYWVSYPEITRMVGGKPIIVHPADGSFYPTVMDIEKAVTPRTKAVLVNSPNNPSGAVYSADFIAEIVTYCENHDIYLIMDDIYHKLIFDGKSTVSAYRFTTKDVESTKVIVINGVSKLYGMTGFRIGWVVASQDIVQVMTNVQGQTITCVSGLLQAGAIGALTGSQQVLADLVKSIEDNRDLVVRELQTIPGLKVTKPEGAFYCLPDFRHYSNDSLALCQLLLEKALVLTVPGKEFGMEGHLRLSFAGDGKEVAEGLRRIRWALDPNAHREIEIGNRKAVRDWA